MPIISCVLGTIPNGKGTGRRVNKRTSGDPPDYSIIKISKNTEKSPGGLLSLILP